jgi:hypothetical protein
LRISPQIATNQHLFLQFVVRFAGSVWLSCLGCLGCLGKARVNQGCGTACIFVVLVLI